MDARPDDRSHATRPEREDSVNTQLDRRLFHLRTLYDVSRELLGVSDVHAALKGFLFMTAGNFGVVDAFLLTQDTSTGQTSHFVSLGLGSERRPPVIGKGLRVLARRSPSGSFVCHEELEKVEGVPRSVSCAVAFAVDDGWCGLLGLGEKIVGGPYTGEDRELLEILVNNLVISLKNARASDALKAAYQEVSSLNRAKDKVINHLSHELKTPMALLSAALVQLERKLSPFPEEAWKRPLLRAKRNADRLSEIQYEVEDIMRDRVFKSHGVLLALLDQCADQLEALVIEQVGEGPPVERIRRRIQEIYGPKEQAPQDNRLDELIGTRLEALKPCFSHRKVQILTSLDVVPPIRMPAEPLTKVIDGLVRNAIENTPDEGRIEVAVRYDGAGEVQLIVQDRGVGILPEHQKRIFEGFFPTQETDDYSSKKPFDFNAGGKGADLLRMKIFSERYHFGIHMQSLRCAHVPKAEDSCPGAISRCGLCKKPEDCHGCGGTTFRVCFRVEAKGGETA